MDNKYILVAGYGWSGSSAVVDLLKEYENVVEPDVEFRLIKDPYGLADLRYKITQNWDALTVDTAIKDFLWYASCLNRSSAKSRFSLSTGLDYNKKLGNHFLAETYRFIDEIVSFTYQSDWWMSSFKKSKYEVLKQKVLNRIRHFEVPKMYFSECSEQKFDENCKKYLNNLFVNYGDKYILLDQAIPPQYPEMAQSYFESAKMIIVDRDPRDIYVDLINGKNLIGLELSRKHDVSKYLLWHNAYRQNEKKIKSMVNVKRIYFEELVLNYDETVQSIESFLNLEDKNHINKKKLFEPLVSKKNIGLWKQYPNQKEIQIIEKELSEFIFEY